MKKQTLFYIGLFLVMGVLLTACGSPGPVGPAGPTGPKGDTGPAGPVAAAADLTCTQCHDSSTLITGKQTEWSTSLHGTGTAYLRGTSASCAGCHSGGGFSARIAAGLAPDKVEAGDPNPTRQDCRACHQIHTTYTKDDFALETTSPVAFFAIPGQTFDHGKGNLCANCHQPRASFPAAVDGKVDISSIRFGPHHGPQSSMLVGIGGAGGVVGSPSKHAEKVQDTCVTCHMGADQNHTFTPNVATCTECHDGAKNFDINDVQTKVTDLLAQLKKALLSKGLITADGLAVVATGLPENQAAALWNFLLVTEDRSMGVHNSTYTIDLLNWSIDALK